MDSILNNLNDPGWWFSVVFVGIFVSVVSGLLKDYFPQVFGHFSGRLKRWSLRRKERREEVTQALARRPVYLLIGWAKTTCYSVVFMGLSVIYFLLPVFVGSQDAGPGNDLNNAIGSFVMIVLYPLIGGLSMGNGYLAASSFGTMSKATRAFRERHGLPKLP